MKNWKTIFGSLGMLVGVAVPSLVTLSCKKEKKTQLENTITVKKENFHLAELGFTEGSLTTDQFKEQITPGFIYKNLNVFFNNIDVNKITEGDIKVQNAIPNTSKDSILISCEIKGHLFQFKIVGFKIEDADSNLTNNFIPNKTVFDATEFSGDSGDLSSKTIAEAKKYIEETTDFIKKHKDVLFNYIHDTLLNSFNTKGNIELTEIGNKLFVTLYENKSDSTKIKFNFEITGFKDDTQSDTPSDTPGGDAIVEIQSSIEIESSDFVDLKDKTLKQGVEFFQGNEQWLLDNQSKIFGTSDLKNTDIEITSIGGPEWIWIAQNDVRIALNVRDKSVLLTIKNFVPNIEVKANLTAADLSFDNVAASEAVSVITKNWISFNIYKLFTITDGVVSSDKISEPVSIVNGNTIEVTVKLFDKEFKFTISGFKNIILQAKQTEFNVKDLKIASAGTTGVKGFLTHMNRIEGSQNYGEGVIEDNADKLFAQGSNLTKDEIKTTEIITKMLGSGVVEVTAKFNNTNSSKIINDITFTVKGLSQDIPYIKNVQATAVRVTGSFGISVGYKFKFVITGEKLPTSKFVDNFRVYSINKTNSKVQSTVRTYWGYVRRVQQTSERIEVEITKTGVWRPGDTMLLIHKSGEIHKDLAKNWRNGFVLTLPR